jgi:hypothetical protein
MTNKKLMADTWTSVIIVTLSPLATKTDAPRYLDKNYKGQRSRTEIVGEDD